MAPLLRADLQHAGKAAIGGRLQGLCSHVWHESGMLLVHAAAALETAGLQPLSGARADAGMLLAPCCATWCCPQP